MKNNYSDVIKVIKYILFNQECTIAEIAAGLDFPTVYVTSVLKSISDDPFIDITLCYSEKYKEKCVFEDISNRDLINKVTWKLDEYELEAIPASILTDEERSILSAVIKCSGIQARGRDYRAILESTPPNPNSTLFLFDIPEKTIDNNKDMKILQKAAQERHYIKVSLSNTTDNYLLKPHGFIRNDLTGEWFLIAQDETDNSKVLLVSNLNSIKTMPGTFTRDVPINREWVLKLLEDDMVEVEVEFDSFETVLKKVRHELGDRGSYTEIEDGKIIFKGTITDLGRFKTFIMRLGSSARVLSPKSLRNEIINEIREIIALHETLDYEA